MTNAPAADRVARSARDTALETAIERLRGGDGAGADAILARIPDDVAVLHLRAVAAHLQQQGAAAERLMAAALEAALHATGQATGDPAKDPAKDPARRGSDDAATVASLYNDLGNMRLESGRPGDAVDAYERSLAVQADDAPTWANLATARRLSGDPVSSGAAALRALELDPASPLGRSAVIAALHALTVEHRTADALEVVRRWSELDPDHPGVRHRLAALGGRPVPDRAPDDYVEGLFDAVADDFEPHVAGLHYRAPELVADRVRELLGQPSARLDVADLGCGTGLAGDLLRPWARTLVGCDLSVGMLRRAQRRGCYDVLHKAELATFARAQPDAYDLVVSVDTLCYVGGLGEVATAVARALRPGGVVVATVERLGDSAPEPWRLTSSGRYAHRQDHLRDVSADVGLADVMVTPVHLRLEAGEPVEGLLWSARRPGAAEAVRAGTGQGRGQTREGMRGRMGG